MTSPGPTTQQYCVYCHTLLRLTDPEVAYPDGRLVSTVDQGMGHPSACPNQVLMLGYPQPHTPGPAGWLPTGKPRKPTYNPPDVWGIHGR